MDSSFLQMALNGYELERQKIEQKIADIQLKLNGRFTRGAVRRPSANRLGTSRTMSAAARRRIAAAQKKLWAEYHKANAGASDKKPTPRVKRILRAAGRKRIVEAAKKRWAALRKKKIGSSAQPKVKAASA